MGDCEAGKELNFHILISTVYADVFQGPSGWKRNVVGIRGNYWHRKNNDLYFRNKWTPESVF